MEARAVRFRALGPITVEVAGQAVKLGGLRQRSVLAVLLHAANQVIAQDALIDAVWAGEPPEAARATVQSYIYNLRRVIGPEAILRRGDGYVIEVDAETFDVLAFERSVRTGTDLLKVDPASARATLVEGLDLWFGTAYGGGEHPGLDADVERLAEMRVTAIETRIEADLALGRAGELIAELGSLVREHPLRERFWCQLMLALYRSGRQAEALRAYQHARANLVDQLGIEPGRELEELEARVLDQDPTLIPPPVLASSVGVDRGPGPIRGYELRGVIGSGELGVVHEAYQPSIGREVAIKVIRPEDANDLTFVARFEREAQRVANLEHPHVLSLHDYWRDPTGAYLVMPLVRGGSLEDSLRSGGWRLEPALRLLDQVGSALAYAHRRGVLHRDVRSSNVLLDEEGNAYLSDFAVAAPTRGPDVGASMRPVPPEELSGEEPTIRSDIFSLGALAFEILSGVPPTVTAGTADLRDVRQDVPEAVAAVVARAMATEPQTRFAKVEEFSRELRRAAGADVVAASEVAPTVSEETRNPYKGLRAFSEDDAVDFHGRDPLVDELLQRIATHRLVTVVGPSGSGKSSVVRAGVIPALRAGALSGSRDWLVTEMFPGSFPFEELEAALSRVAVRAPGSTLDDLTQPNGLLRVSKQILPGDDATLLLIIDQFEELFSAVRSEEVRRRFLDNLVAVASDERSRVRVVATIRADFLDRPLAYADLAEAIADGLVTVGPPTRDGLAQAVAAPARTVGLNLEAGLVGRIIVDVEGQPGTLPLLQYALTEMFEHRESSTLTIAGYEAAGGVAGALGRRAEELYDGLTPAGKAATRQIFLRLVTVDEAGSVTRRRARQSELLSLAIDRRGAESGLQAFSSFRLLTFDRDPVTRGPTVEVAHEALLTAWPRLQGWIEDARESLVLARRVGEAAQEWHASDEDPSYLLRGVRLEDVEARTAQAEVVLTSDEARYIAASVAQRATDARAARRRRRRAIAALSGGLIVVSALAVVAFLLRGVAQREARQARVRELAAASIGHLDENRELALLIAAEAFDTSIRGGGAPNAEAVSAMAQAIADWRLVSRLPAGHPVTPPATAPDGSVVAVASDGSPGDVDLFDAAGSPLGTLPGPAEPSVSAWEIDVSPDAATVAVTYAAPHHDRYRAPPDGVPELQVFDVASTSSILRLDTDQGLRRVSFSPDGDRLAVSFEREVHVLHTADGARISRFESSSLVGRPAFAGDDVLVPIEGSGFTVVSAADGSVLDHIEVEELDPSVTAVNEAGTHVAFRDGENLRVLELATGRTVYDRSAPSVVAVALDADATRFAHAGYDPTITVEGLEGAAAREIQLTGTLENVLALTFLGEDGLVSGGEDALVWDVSPEGVPELGGLPLREPQWSFEVSPDGRWLAYFVSISFGGPVGDPSDGLRMVDLTTGAETVVSRGERNSVPSGLRSVSPDFSAIGSLTLDGESTLRSLPDYELLHEFEACRTPLALTPDNGRVVLTGWGCGDPVPDLARSSVVDLGSGEEILSLPYQTLWSARFNPPGVVEGGRLLAATDQTSVGIWDVEDGSLLASFDTAERPDFGALMVLAFDPSGRYLVGGTTGGAVWVADVERVFESDDLTDAFVFDRQAHTGAAPVPSVSAAGVVATAGFDGMVRLWDLHSEDLIMEFESNVGIPAVRFSPDGTELLYPDGLSIRRMPIDPHRLREVADDLLTRDFLPDECERYASPDRCDRGRG